MNSPYLIFIKKILDRNFSEIKIEDFEKFLQLVFMFGAIFTLISVSYEYFVVKNKIIFVDMHNIRSLPYIHNNNKEEVEMIKDRAFIQNLTETTIYPDNKPAFYSCDIEKTSESTFLMSITRTKTAHVKNFILLRLCALAKSLILNFKKTVSE